MCLRIKRSLFKKGGGFKKPLKLKTIIKPKKEILRYNVFAIFIFRF